MTHPRRSLLVPCLALVWLAGCTSDLVYPTCDDRLRLVLQGEVSGQAVEVQSAAIQGRWLSDSFYFALPDPQVQGGVWVLQLGYNPELDDLGFAYPPSLANDMARAGTLQFRVSNRLPSAVDDLASQRCDPSRGELCGGLRIYAPGTFDPAFDLPGDMPSSGYLPVRSGTFTFSELSGADLRGTYDLELDWDRENTKRGRGGLVGCFRAERIRTPPGDTLQ